ncbi:MAG: decaprenyl-phosphate phosphoribosyltransferase [Bacteroidota bacterium]
MIVATIKLMRPLQWLKNGFVFTPLIFSKHLLHADYAVSAVLAFFAFCFASSAVYILNDILDKESDTLHPIKKKRPIASGELSVRFALTIAFIVCIIAIAFSSYLPSGFSWILLLYVAIQVAYSFRLKKVVILDIFVIAAGFMLRVFAGALAIQVSISHWIVITTLFLSLFLAISKRRSELVMITKQNIESPRRVLKEYSIPFLDALLIISTTGMVLSYSLYTMAEKTIVVFGSEYLIFTTVFVLFGIFRYLFLVFVREEGENPALILVKDAPMALNMSLWLITCIAIIYFS